MTYTEQVNRHRLFFKSDQTIDISYRIEMLKRLHRTIIAREEDIAAALHADLGKSMQEVITTEIGQITGEIKYLIKNIRKHTGKKRKATNMLNIPSKSYTIREPYGVTLVMGPWNYPFQLVMAPVAAAIAGGNCVVVKPSEISANTAGVIESIIDECFDESYISTVLGGVEETTALLEERFDMIFFTGSPKVGRIVMEKAARHLTPVVLELGGKSPCVVDKNTKLDVALRRIIFGKATNAGQTCVAPDYILVHDDIADEFYAHFEMIAEAFYDHEYRDNADFGRIINEGNYDRLTGFLHDGQIIYGGTHDREQLHIDLTLIEVTDLNKPIMTEEIFGPILPVVRYKTIDEAIEIISKNPDPLAMYVFSDDRAVQDTLLNRVQFGGGCINDTLLHLSNEHLPFGGRGTSGIGNYHGRYSIEAFTHEKAILHSRTFFDLMLKYPPFKDKTIPMLKRLMY